ncbi:glycosyltransferase [Azospirillum sp. TSH64]|uniref:glycosyltransferase n=1 Tax=Azospirillum sp. TSH64 TaxID=652740 RepID=UPI000D69E7C2|nr:glycosyltransferase [Azospirillum sp. TSH64]
MVDFERLFAECRLADAESLATRRLGQNRWHEEALTVLARCALARGNYEAALSFADRNRRLEPKRLSFACFLSVIELARGNAAAALQALDDFPAECLSAEAVVARTRALMLLGKQDEALDHAALILQRFPAFQTPLCVDLLNEVTVACASPGWVTPDLDGRLKGTLHPSVFSPSERFAILRLVIEGTVAFDLPTDEFASRFGDMGPPGSALPFHIADHRVDPGSRFALFFDGRRLLGSGEAPDHVRPEGDCSIVEDLLSGWVWLPSLPDKRLAVRVSDQGGRQVTIQADRLNPLLRRNNIGDGRYGFSLDLRQAGLRPGQITACAGIDGLTPGSGKWSGGAAGMAIGDALPWSATPARPARIALTPRPEVTAGPARHADRMAPPPAVHIDVIIPVYRGREETLACIESVRGSVTGPVQIIVVDDASPDAALSDDLRRLAGDGVIHLLVNDRNLGFPRSVNRALSLHRGHDVVLLNSDTAVSGDWLARLRLAAYSRHDIGTVTPLSNDAEILSYPLAPAHRRVPDTEEAAALHRLARSQNDAIRIEVPTAVGFCTYIRHDCLAATGLLDVALFGRGYGEENDFCLRASALGWRHLAAADVFVAHVGGRSFGRRKAVLSETNLDTLNRLHPGYDGLIRQFHRDDPLSGVRRRLDLARHRARLRESPPAKPTVLIVTFGRAGGVAHFVSRRIETLKNEGRRVVVLTTASSLPGDVRRCRVEDRDQPDLQDLVFQTSNEFDLLTDFLKGLRLDSVEVQHYLDHDPAVLDLLGRLGVPYDVYVHDYSWFCPQIVMIDASNRYCGEPDLAACENCALTTPPATGERISVAALRKRTAHVLHGARRVVVPSHDVAGRVRRHAPAARLSVVPWDAVRPPTCPAPVQASAANGRWRVCVIGAIGAHKGHSVLLDCALDAARRDLPLEFVVVGYTLDDTALFETERVFVTGPFSEEEVTDLVRRERVHLALFPSLCPETWSYALSHAWASGLTAVGFDIGTIAERIRESDGYVMPYDLTAEAINDRLMAILAEAVPLLPGRMDNRKSIGKIAENAALDAAGLHSFSGESSLVQDIRIIFSSAKDLASMPPFQTSDTQAPAQYAASAQLITFHPGVYAVTVVRGEATGIGENGMLPIPSIHLTPLPATAANVQMLGDGWLFKTADAVAIKVSGSPSDVLLTSYQRTGDGRSLGVQITRIDSSPSKAPQTQPKPPAVIRTKMLAHVQNRGDIEAPDGGWAGAPDQKFAIEGFSITPLDGMPADFIEYKSLNLNGQETPWVGGGSLCGSRGLGIPLTGLAIRLKGMFAERFDCAYEIVFLSGARSPVLTNGQPYRSDISADPILAFTLRIVERAPALPAPSFS